MIPRRRALRRGVRLALVAVLAVACAAVLRPPAAVALDNGLARVPYMGWNTFLAFHTQYDDATIRSTADAMVTSGLARAGYRYVWIDGGWWWGSRGRKGNITVSRRRWPHGMRSVVNYIHKLGLRAGIYTDAGNTGCDWRGDGSWGHYAQDVNQFAAWGFDAVKVDFCGGRRMGLNPPYAYALFRDALAHNSSHRAMLFAICNPFTPASMGPNDPTYERSAFASWSYGEATANSWRTGTDVGFSHIVRFGEVLRNLDTDSAHPEAAGPGHWNDPDFLAPDLGMTDVENRTQFSMWAIVAAPLVLGDDVRSITPATLATVTNPDVIAVDQDSAGVQGTRVAASGQAEMWVKPLANGDRAVALLNRGSDQVTIATTAHDAGFGDSASYRVHDLWSGGTTQTSGPISADVPAHGVSLFRVSPGG